MNKLNIFIILALITTIGSIHPQPSAKKREHIYTFINDTDEGFDVYFNFKRKDTQKWVQIKPKKQGTFKTDVCLKYLVVMQGEAIYYNKKVNICTDKTFHIVYEKKKTWGWGRSKIRVDWKP